MGTAQYVILLRFRGTCLFDRWAALWGCGAIQDTS